MSTSFVDKLILLSIDNPWTFMEEFMKFSPIQQATLLKDFNITDRIKSLEALINNDIKIMDVLYL